MAQPFYSSGESIRVMHGFSPCSNDTTSVVSSLSFIYSDFLSRQVISRVSDYKFGIATSHTDPSMTRKSSFATDGTILFATIHFDEYLLSSSLKPFET